MSNMQQEHGAGSTLPNSLLQDAPDLWKRQLVSGQYLDTASKLSLFQTCRQLSEMVMQHSKSTCLKLEMLSEPPDRAVEIMRMANSLASNIRMSLYHKKLMPPEVGVHVVACNYLQAAAKQGALSVVTELQLQHASLEAILSPAIGQACPNLTKLSLLSCTVSLRGSINFSKEFRNLQSLVLDCNQYLRPVSSDINPDGLTQQLRLQLMGLPSLRSLTVVCHPRGPDSETVFIIMNSLAPRLTHLCYKQAGVPVYLRYTLKQLDWVPLAASLQHLRLIDVGAVDEAMKIFLNMPCLKILDLAFVKLEESFAGQPCKWQELSVSEADLKALAHLPIHSGMTLKVDRLTIVLLGDTACHQTRQAITNVQRADVLIWRGRGETRVTPMRSASEFADWLALALPLYGRAKRIMIWSSHLNGAAMQTLCNMVCNRGDGPYVKLCECTWGLAAAVDLVRSMPHNSVFDIDIFKGEDVQQQIIRLCCAARHKFTLRVVRVYDVQVCELHIRSAVQACGLEVLSLNPDHHDEWSTGLMSTVKPSFHTLA